MFTHPLQAGAQVLQPFVLLGDGLYVKTRLQGGDVRLVSALGVVHPLRRLASWRVWQEHAARLVYDEFVHAVRTESTRRSAAASGATLAYFLSIVVPTFDARQWATERASVEKTPDRSVAQQSSAHDVLASARHLAPPALPVPGLIVLGRVWSLGVASSLPRGVHVRVGPDILAPTGEQVSTRSLRANWHEQVERAVRETAIEVPASTGDAGPALSADDRESLARTGAVERGDLVFLDTSPPQIGHIIPPHQNQTLGRHSARDLLIAAPFSIVPGESGPRQLAVFERTRPAAWIQLSLPHGLCLGPGAPDPSKLDPDVRCAVMLRWAAIRIGMNGRFHEAD